VLGSILRRFHWHSAESSISFADCCSWELHCLSKYSVAIFANSDTSFGRTAWILASGRIAQSSGARSAILESQVSHADSSVATSTRVLERERIFSLPFVRLPFSEDLCQYPRPPASGKHWFGRFRLVGEDSYFSIKIIPETRTGPHSSK
jgi:hypothetical protein